MCVWWEVGGGGGGARASGCNLIRTNSPLIFLFTSFVYGILYCPIRVEGEREREERERERERERGGGGVEACGAERHTIMLTERTACFCPA